jgi:phosphoglycolate phosphatase
MDKLVLFDLDKTLVADSKNISEYVAESIRNIYGMVVTVDLKKYEGDTAQNIAEAVLKEAGMPDNEILPRLNRYMEDVFYTYYNVAGHDKLLLKEGAKELLMELDKRSVLMGIATGEGERIVKFKTDKAGITQFFKLGAYGNTAKDFPQIIRSAVDDAVGRHGFNGRGIFIVSSSPYALKGAKELGFYAIGIANGGYKEPDLEAAGADLVVKSVKDRGRILGFLESH